MDSTLVSENNEGDWIVSWDPALVAKKFHERMKVADYSVALF